MFNKFLYQPILGVLVFIYNNIAFHDLGLSIILLTVFIRLILLPFFYQGAKAQTKIQRLQPLVKKIQEDHKNNKEKQTHALLDLYKEHKINPFSSILLLVIQLPILIALYRVFLTGLSSSVFINYNFLGVIDLNQKSFLITILAVLAQYFQGRMMLPKKSGTGQTTGADKTNKAMLLYLGPALTLIVLFNLPSALGLYWFVSSLFSLVQQFFINKNLEKHAQ